MNSEFVVDYGTGQDRHRVKFEHLHEVLDFVSMKLCQGVRVEVLPNWRPNK